MKFNSLFKIRKEDHIEFLNEITPLLDKGMEIKYSNDFKNKYPYNTNERVQALTSLFRDVGIHNLIKNFLLFDKIPLFKPYKYHTEFQFNGFLVKKEKSEKGAGFENDYFFNNKIQPHIENQIKLIKSNLTNSMNHNKNAATNLQTYANKLFQNLEIIFEEVLNIKGMSRKDLIENFNEELFHTDSWFIYSILFNFIVDNDPKYNSLLPTIKNLKLLEESKNKLTENLLEVSRGKKELSHQFLEDQFKFYNLIFFGNENSNR